MEINELIKEGEISRICHENCHLKNISYFCENHNEFFCECCLKKEENCKKLQFNTFKDMQKNKIKANIKNLEKISNIIEEKNDKLKNIYGQINNNLNKLINDINLVFSSLINELSSKQKDLLLIVKKKYNIQFFENSFKEFDNLNNDIKKLIKKEEIFKAKWSDKSDINDCIPIKKNIEEMKNINDNINQHISSKEKYEKKLKEEHKKLNLFLSKIENFHQNFKNNNKETYNVFNNLLKTLVPIANNLDKKQIKNVEESKGKNNNNIVVKTGNIKTNNFFTSKDIQIKLSEIFDYFKIYSNNFFDDNEEIENQKIGEFLLKVANISRLSYNHSNIILKIMYNDFKEYKNNYEKNTITYLNEIKEEFSSWVKNNINDIINKISNYLNDLGISYIKEEEDYNNRKFFKKLISELSILFFECELSFPPIKIDFNLTENIFINDKMIDFAHNRGKKKVNFVFFPSFQSNNNYLDNGKQWVFTYVDRKKKTFYFEDMKLEPLLEKNKFCIPKLSEILELNVKIIQKKTIIPIINYSISEKSKKEFIFYLKNKKDNTTFKITSEKQIEIEEDLDLIKLDFYLMSEYILSYPKNDIIINKDNNI